MVTISIVSVVIGGGQQFAVQSVVAAVPVSAPLGGEGSIATINSALVHQLQMNTLIVELDREMIGEHFSTVHTPQRILFVNRNISLQ